MTLHAIILYRDDNRMGSHYGQHYYVETMNGERVKVEYLDYLAYDRDHAMVWARAVARTYGANVVDRRPDVSLYGWSAD